MKHSKWVYSLNLLSLVLASGVAAAMPKAQVPQACAAILVNPPQPFDFHQTNTAATDAFLKWIDELKLNQDEIIASMSKSADFRRFLQDQDLGWWNQFDQQMKMKILISFIEKRWQDLADMPYESRNDLLFVDLIKLGLVQDKVLQRWHARSILEEISASNLEHMLPFVRSRDPDLNLLEHNQKSLDQALDSVSVEFVKSYYRRSEIARAPILSEPQLSRLGLNPEPSFWDTFTGGSPSVGLRVALKSSAEERYKNPFTIRDDSSFKDVIINSEFVKTNGFVLPALRSVHDLFILLRYWEPDILQKFLNDNRRLIGDANQNMDVFVKLQDDEIETFFPAHDPYGKLLPLRKRLLGFILTANDFKTLIREAARVYLRSNFLVSFGHGLAGISDMKRRPNERLVLVNYWLGMPSGWDARIPGAVPIDEWWRRGTTLLPKATPQIDSNPE